jgi:hypothetical protein
MRVPPLRRVCWPLAALAVAFSACSPDPAKRSVQVHELGEKVEFAPFILSAIDTQWLTQLGEGPAPRLPVHRFLVVRITAMNTGSAETTLPLLSLADAAGGEHAEIADPGGLPRWLGLARSVKPAATIEGDIVFDVAPGTYRLRIQDAFDENKVAMINLPLKFDSPEGLLPQSRQDKPVYEELLRKQ